MNTFYPTNDAQAIEFRAKVISTPPPTFVLPPAPIITWDFASTAIFYTGIGVFLNVKAQSLRGHKGVIELR